MFNLLMSECKPAWNRRIGHFNWMSNMFSNISNASTMFVFCLFLILCLCFILFGVLRIFCILICFYFFFIFVLPWENMVAKKTRRVKFAKSALFFFVTRFVCFFVFFFNILFYSWATFKNMPRGNQYILKENSQSSVSFVSLFSFPLCFFFVLAF